jgi:hypothetical protein
MSWSFFVKLFHMTRSSIHLSCHPSMDGIIDKKTLVEINNPPFSTHVLLSRKSMPSPKRAPSRFWYQYQQQTQHIFPHICNDNHQESRSNIEQCWDIFVVSSVLPWLAVCCYLTGHKQCKHQDFQRPGPPMNTCEMWYIERFWKCSL